MKPYLPYNILLVLTIITAGLTVLYNYTLSEGQAATLQYRYPVVERQSEPEVQEPERFVPEPDYSDEELDEAAPENADDAAEYDLEPERITSVQFPLDINAATTEQLKFIPQVGDVMSQRIVQYREVLGGYTDLEQLKDIKGVGENTYKHLYAYLIIAQEDLADEISVSMAEESGEE